MFLDVLYLLRLRSVLYVMFWTYHVWLCYVCHVLVVLRMSCFRLVIYVMF